MLYWSSYLLFVLLVVEIDESDKLDNLLTIARRYFDERDFEEAYKYYSQALPYAPNNWEIVFFTTYCKANMSVLDNTEKYHAIEDY